MTSHRQNNSKLKWSCAAIVVLGAAAITAGTAWKNKDTRYVDTSSNKDVSLHEQEKLEVRRQMKILTQLREHKKTQAATVRRLQKIASILKQDLELDKQGRLVKAIDPSMKKLVDLISATKIEIDDLRASIRTQEQLIKLHGSNLDLVSDSSVLRIAKLQDKLRAKEEEVARIEATAVHGRDSRFYITAMNQLNTLATQVPIEIEEIETSAVRTYAGQQLYEKKIQFLQKLNLLERLEMRREFATTSGRTPHEFNVATQELQRALRLYAKISKRETQFSASLSFPKERSDSP